MRPGAFTVFQLPGAESAEARLPGIRATPAAEGWPCLGGWMSNSLESLMRGAPIEAPRPTVVTELVSFGAVGGIAALGFIGLSMLMVGLKIGPDWLVSAGCYALFIVPVYLAHRRVSFRSSAPHSVALPRYIAVQVSALVLASLFSYVCYSVLGLQTALAAFIVIVLTSGINFAVLKLWAFAHRS